MILLQQLDFKLATKLLIFLIVGIQAAFAIQIEAPKEIEEHVLAYSNEAGAENMNATLRVSIIKKINCKAFAMKLIDKSKGKTLKETERCFTEFPNSALQNGIFELFGHKVNTETELSEYTKTVLFGIGFAATGALLYYSKQPKPVYGYSKNKISEVAE